ncbi:TetR/AcrR family transcriptional regulator [Shewanella gaetbuli]
MKRVKQIEESKKLIGDALLRLLKEQDFDDISISKITQEAGVSRMTFYRNFETKEQIVKHIMQSTHDDIFQAIQRIENPTLEHILNLRFVAIQKNTAILNLGAQAYTMNVMQQFHDEKLDDFKFFLGDADQFATAFYLGGLNLLTAKWIETGMKESPNMMTQKVMKLIRPN